MIKLNIPYYNKECIKYVNDSQENNKSYIDKCKIYFNDKWGFNNTIMTTSCTHSMEIMAMSLNIQSGCEILMPAFTFVSTANAFEKFGARVRFVDSLEDSPNINPDMIEKNITENTKALIIVHYAGVSCDMEKICDICKKYNIILLEDCAQAINSYNKDKPLGSYGVMSAFSFHSTKNIQCSEGGLLVINDDKYTDIAKCVSEKGTNRHNFLQGKINKYEWVTKGSSYTLGEINAAYLYHQLININMITDKRLKIWKLYYDNLHKFLNVSKEYNGHNGHIFYIVFENESKRQKIQNILNKNSIQSCTHYISLHNSKYYRKKYKCIENFENSTRYEKNLLRLPIYDGLELDIVDRICSIIINNI